MKYINLDISNGLIKSLSIQKDHLTAEIASGMDTYFYTILHPSETNVHDASIKKLYDDLKSPNFIKDFKIGHLRLVCVDDGKVQVLVSGLNDSKKIVAVISSHATYIKEKTGCEIISYSTVAK